MSRKSISTKSAKRKLEDLDLVLRSLAHETRRHILVVLRMRSGQMTSRDIAERFSCTWPTVTRHLRQLESSGLVWVERKGNERIYHLDEEKLYHVVGDWLSWFQPARKDK